MLGRTQSCPGLHSAHGPQVGEVWFKALEKRRSVRVGRREERLLTGGREYNTTSSGYMQVLWRQEDLSPNMSNDGYNYSQTSHTYSLLTPSSLAVK